MVRFAVVVLNCASSCEVLQISMKMFLMAHAQPFWFHDNSGTDVKVDSRVNLAHIALDEKIERTSPHFHQPMRE